MESEYKPGLICNEYAYYEVVTYDELTIGDQITFHGYKLYVGAVTIELKDGILVYRCKLVRYMTLRQNPILNEKFQGVSLEGKVLSVQ
ncbi:MAG: wapA2, partial [Pelosinus sp.]|nr:wapA2 [Pelosinus sp.]